MENPSFTSTGIAAVQNYLLKKNKLRTLNDTSSNIRTPIITGCPPLNWAVDNTGFPRGIVAEISGPESSGKCVALNSTYVPFHEEGILTLEELFKDLPWISDSEGKTIPNTQASLRGKVFGSNNEPTQTLQAFYAGITPTVTIETEGGLSLKGTPEHRILMFPENGILRWTSLSDLRLSQLVVTSVGHEVSGKIKSILDRDLPDKKTEKEKVAWVCLLGALAGVELRGEDLVLNLSSRNQLGMIRNWAQMALGDSGADPFNEDMEDFTKFTGIAYLPAGFWVDLAKKAISTVPDLIRKSSLVTQASWCLGLTLTKGCWTKDDLEFELMNEKTAKAFHLIMENLGIRMMFYPTINTFGEDRFKLALRDRNAQQKAQEIIWHDTKLPADWKKNYCVEAPEMHQLVTETMRRAWEIIKNSPSGFSIPHLGRLNCLPNLVEGTIDLEDTDKENLAVMAVTLHEILKQKKNGGKTESRIYETLLLLSSPYVFLDRTVQVKQTEPTATGDIYVPIGSHYAANGMISHNSTLAMYLADQELAHNPDAVAVMQDYERSTTTQYARQMKLHRHKDQNGRERFHLIPSDTLEEAEELIKFYYSNKVYPSIWIIDSVPAMIPQAMWDKEADEVGPIGSQARGLAPILGQLVKFAADYGTTFIFINQIRAFISTDISVKSKYIPGIAGSDKENTPGGYAMKFYSSLRLDLRPKNVIKAKIYNPMTGENEEIPIANIVKATARKNKTGSPYKSGSFYIQFGQGVDMPRTLFDLAIRKNVITKSGSQISLSLPDGSIVSATGQEKFIELMKQGSYSKTIMEYLEKSLEWDRSQEYSSQILGFSSEDTETGLTSQLDAVDALGGALEGRLAFIRSQTSLIGKADALGLISREGKVLTWTNPESQANFRGQREDSLEKKIQGDDRKKLNALVEVSIAKMMEAMEKEKQQKIAEREAHQTPDSAIEVSGVVLAETLLQETPVPNGEETKKEGD